MSRYTIGEWRAISRIHRRIHWDTEDTRPLPRSTLKGNEAVARADVLTELVPVHGAPCHVPYLLVVNRCRHHPLTGREEGHGVDWGVV